MVTAAVCKTLIMALGDVNEAPHFEKTAFKANRKIFASLNKVGNAIHIKLSPIDQSAFSAFDNTIIFSVPNKWGLQGWTTIKLTKVRKTTLNDALKAAYNLCMESNKKSKK